MTEDFKRPIQREQISIAMGQLPTMQAASLIIALILSYTVRNSVPHVKILEFLTLIFVIVLCRIVLYLRFRKVREASFSANLWENAYLILALISGLFWGLSAFLIFPAANPLLMSLFILAMSALAAGTTLSHTSIRFASLAWTGPAGICYAIRFAMEGSEFGRSLALMTIVYTLAILIHALKHNKFITSAVLLKHENRELLREVTKVNDSLRQEIAERKQMEQSLRDGEQRLSTILQTANEGFWLIDNDAVTLDLNARMSAILGRDREEVLGRKIFDFVDEPDRAIFEQQIKARGLGRVGSYEMALSRRDGTHVFCHVNGTALRDGAGDSAGAFAMVTDISERKRAEMALKESEERYRAIFENTGAATVIIDEKAIILLANAEFLKLTGYAREEIEGRKSWKEFVVKEDLERMLGQNRLRLVDPDSAMKDYEFRLMDKVGQVKDILLTIDMIPSSRKIVCSLLDITERKRAEEAAFRAKRDWEETFDAVPDLISLLDRDYRMVRVNKAMAAKLGLAPEKCVGLICYESVHGTDSPPPFCPHKQLLSDGLGHTEEVFEKRLGGDYIVSVSPFYDTEGKLAGSVHVCRDITARKQAEEERRRLEEQLQRAEKMQALGVLAGGVAHDLNNVLGVVIGYSELFLHIQGSNESTKSTAAKILKAGQRAAAIVQDLLTLARRGIQDKKVLNLNDILQESLNSPEFARVMYYHPEVMVKTDLEPELLNISGSSVHLEKSFINLVSNAAEAMPDGGTLTIKTINQYMDKPVSGYEEVREGDYVVLVVSDTGEGIPAGDLKRIFEPFYTKKVMGRSGTGLGLAVVWGTVKDHNGYINVKSEEGKGTIFTLYFPVTRKDLTPEQVAVSTSRYMGKGESILVVDDVQEQRELATALLTTLNYNVVSVSSGEEAVEHIKHKKPDLLVLDMIMDPGMDGLDTYLKILEIRTQQKAIIVSGFSETERVSKALALGAGSYVKKPYVLEKLGLAVRKELDKPT